MSKRRRQPRHSRPSSARETEEGCQPSAEGISPAVAWIMVIAGVIILWPWISWIVCGLTGVCLAPGDHVGGWMSQHKIDSSNGRLVLGLLASAGGFRGLSGSKHS